MAYRGDFIGFSSALPDIELIEPIDETVFYHSGIPSKTRNYFEFLEVSTEKLEPHHLPIFFGGHHDEERHN